MSTFKVSLSNTSQGTLDSIKDSNGNSLQRSVYVMGPKKINRLLKDGDTFTDSNYWKRFAYPQVPLEQAFIVVTSDDGSVYSDIEEENTFPYATSVVCTGGTTYTDNVVDLNAALGGPATFTQITNQSGSQDVKIKLNGSSTAIFTLPHASTQVFNHEDLAVTKIQIDNSTSGAISATVQIVAAGQSISKS